jgi:hypothetical protein
LIAQLARRARPAAAAKRLFRPIEQTIGILGRKRRHLSMMAEGKSVTAP